MQSHGLSERSSCFLVGLEVNRVSRVTWQRCLIGVKNSDWPLMRSRAFLGWASSLPFCYMSLTNKNGMTAELVLDICSLAGRILPNPGFTERKNKGVSGGEKFGTRSGVSSSPPPSMHNSPGINRVPWGHSGACLLCEKTPRETV